MKFDNDPTLRQLQNATATGMQWNVADACNRAIWPYLMTLSFDSKAKQPTWLEEGRVDFQLVAQLCTKLSMLGLAPADLDNPEGHAAIHAIAGAIMCASAHPTEVRIHDEVSITVPTPEWRKVTLAAQHLLWRQPRRYEVDEKPG